MSTDDFSAIRRLAIVSMFADDELMRRLVLKGGNALSLVHGIGTRTSLDLDFSLADDFVDLVQVERRLLHALAERFDAAGYEVFDARLTAKPKDPDGRPPTWGGYRLEFKAIRRSSASRLPSIEQRRREAELTGPAQQRTFRIEISKHEYCEEKMEVELDGFTIYVYPPAMIAVEKLRAICQQMPSYPLVRNKRARARDFYDIYSILAARQIEIGELGQLVAHVFAAKDVPLMLLAEIPQQREFHRSDWAAVINSVSGEVESFDFYFDAVVAATRGLEPLWEE